MRLLSSSFCIIILLHVSLVTGITKHEVRLAQCTHWNATACPLEHPLLPVRTEVNHATQTLCKADVSIRVQQVDWLSRAGGKGMISKLKLNGVNLLSNNLPLLPSDHLAAVVQVYPQCEQWIDAFPPYATLQTDILGPRHSLLQPDIKTDRTSIAIIDANDSLISISTDIEFVWQGPHIKDGAVCSFSGVSYAAVTQFDYYFEIQEKSLCPGWNATFNTVCHDHGSCNCADSDSSIRPCVCNAGYGGPDCADCEYSKFFGSNCTKVCPTCLNGGVCDSGTNGSGSCLCPPGFDAATNCASCLPSHFGPNCLPCPDCNYPNGNCVDGITGNGRCACGVGWDMKHNCSECMDNFYGPQCVPCDPCGNEGTCRHGTKGDGSCRCNNGFDPESRCSDCLGDYYGPNCTKCVTCHSHGTCNDLISGDGTCSCERGYSPVSRCLRCDVGWDFNPTTMQCQCAPEHWGPDCRSCPICAPHGRCNAGGDGDGSCICDIGFSNSNNCVGCMTGYVGYDCQRCRHCLHGKCDDGLRGTGECDCHRGWSSESDCYDCAAGFFGPNCDECTDDCGRHGECSSGLNGTGSCICDIGWSVQSSPPCRTCLDGYLGPNCTACPGLLTMQGLACSGHGVCSVDSASASNICKCDARYTGADCSHYEFPIVMVAVLGLVALTTLGICMCTMRRLARGPSGGLEGPGILATGRGGRIGGGSGARSSFMKGEYMEISGESDLEYFLSADTKDWVIPFESLTLQFEVGNGTSGQVFKSVYHSGGGSSVVAVKRLYSPVTGQEYFQNFFRREVSILSKLHHPNVVRFYGVSYYSRILYIVTDFCPASLSELIENPATTGTFEHSFFIKIVTQITSGMGFLHSRNVVHRDLKPANVLLTDTGDVNICDFGLSRLIDPEATSMTAEVGTPSYMAPEMATMGGTQCSTKGDVYSFGILLYSMWTRSKPYGDQGMNPFQLMTAVVNGLRPVIPINCPPALAALMVACWDANPDTRPSFPEISLHLKDDALLRMPDLSATGTSVTSAAETNSSNPPPVRRKSLREVSQGSLLSSSGENAIYGSTTSKKDE